MSKKNWKCIFYLKNTLIFFWISICMWTSLLCITEPEQQTVVAFLQINCQGKWYVPIGAHRGLALKILILSCKATLDKIHHTGPLDKISWSWYNQPGFHNESRNEFLFFVKCWRSSLKLTLFTRISLVKLFWALFIKMETLTLHLFVWNQLAFSLLRQLNHEWFKFLFQLFRYREYLKGILALWYAITTCKKIFQSI